jgi:hypothetical protein
MLRRSCNPDRGLITAVESCWICDVEPQPYLSKLIAWSRGVDERAIQAGGCESPKRGDRAVDLG